MGILSAEMKRMVAELKLCFVATVTPDGRPNLSPKGSMKVWDDDHLVFADIASPVTVRNLNANPHIEINMVDPFRRRGFRFKGTAVVLHEGAEFSSVADELWSREGRQYPVNGVIKMKVEEALPVLSPAYTFNQNVREDDVRRVWLERYGVQEAKTAPAKAQQPTVKV
jgi:predicted pyridoxine 5'-phosphate oxidase superfamily flavin-nucleotide-binding protein